MRQPIAQDGFSMIELLVTVVIFSVGLLGVAGLQIVSKRAAFEAMHRATASEVAYGLLEDMRANGPALGDYVATAQIGQNTMAVAPTTLAIMCADSNNPCTETSIATRDLAHWESVLDGSMEGGAGGLIYPLACITGPPGGVTGVYMVTIVWRGTVSTTDPGITTCGDDNNQQYGDFNEFRRVMQIPTFIDPNI